MRNIDKLCSDIRSGYIKPSDSVYIKARIESLITESIAAHEAEKWHYLPELPAAYKTGEWDGKRSDYVLAECSDLNFRVARIYNGILDGYEFTDWFDQYDDDIIFDVIRWRELPQPYKGGER